MQGEALSPALKAWKAFKQSVPWELCRLSLPTIKVIDISVLL